MKMVRRSWAVRVLAVILALAALWAVRPVGQPTALGTVSAAGVDAGVTARPFFDIFMDVPGVKGESANLSQKGLIELLSWSWGIWQAPIAEGCDAAGWDWTGRITVIKRIDTTTPLLFKRCVDHTAVPLVTVYLVREDGQTCLKYELRDVMIGSILHTNDLDGDGRSEETLELSFAGARLTYTLFDIAGKPAGQATAEW